MAEPRQERGKGRSGRDGEARSAQPKAQCDRVPDESGESQSRRAPHASLEKVRLPVLRWAVGGQSASSYSVAGKHPAGGLDVQESEVRAEMPRDGGASAARKRLPGGGGGRASPVEKGAKAGAGRAGAGQQDLQALWLRVSPWRRCTPVSKRKGRRGPVVLLGIWVTPSRDREWTGPT